MRIRLLSLAEPSAALAEPQLRRHLMYSVGSIGAVLVSAGSLTKSGSGTVTLTANNSYTGGTTINSGGTLRLGSGGTTGSIIGGTSGIVTDSGSLEFKRSDTTVGHAIAGTGAVIQSGSGRVILTPANTYTGGTTIESGNAPNRQRRYYGLHCWRHQWHRHR